GSAAWEITLERVTRLHAAAIFVDQFAHGDAGRCQHHARLVDAAGDREAAETLALAPAMRREPSGALLHDVAHPVERLDVLLERGTTEQAPLRHVGWPVARQSALALDRFDHRRLFAADVGAGATAKMYPRVWRQPCALGLHDLLRQQEPHLGIF